MNIADRAGLYAQAFRVLRPGGVLAIHDVVAGPQTPLIFPVPWARDPAHSFLLSPEAMRAALLEAGFVVRDWQDRTEDTRAWSAARAGTPAPAGPLGLHLAMGADFPALTANLARNLREGRACIVQAVLLRP